MWQFLTNFNVDYQYFSIFMWQYVAIMAENLTIELLENVIFWEKHPEIYQSLNLSSGKDIR